ncbi:RNA-binding protein 39 [Coelomomyces lativittatus]|nr:RNA-binding protein 39 [Coelomomyces lativittatus]
MNGAKTKRFLPWFFFAIQGVKLISSFLFFLNFWLRFLKCNHTNAYTDDIWRHFAPRLPTRLYFANVHPLATESDMRTLFEPFGKIENFSLCPDVNTARHKSYGFIEFSDDMSALSALRSLDNVNIEGERLLVTKTLVGGPFPEGMSALNRFPPPPQLRSLPRHHHHSKPSEPPRTLTMPVILPDPPSCVLVLKNMVSPNEIDSYLKQDVLEECERCGGKVVSMEIYANPHLVQDQESGVRVFVEFGSADERQACQNVMNGRFFAGRKVSAIPYPLSKYKNREFDE